MNCPKCKAELEIDVHEETSSMYGLKCPSCGYHIFVSEEELQFRNEIKDFLKDSLEKLKPMNKQITELISQAYEIGFDAGMTAYQRFYIKNNSE